MLVEKGGTYIGPDWPGAGIKKVHKSCRKTYHNTVAPSDQFIVRTNSQNDISSPLALLKNDLLHKSKAFK